ncbi:hypothetical protein Vadar_027307 [Vaccinium darrowii]|uniref:Uncharacterized protein n=1 Tax=Vaccinium darrowii TaxID=229202 RepID=A0ACB7Y2K1_9ERIC|nr:hypothetical protein Vadar_027307 [Vaccinium darrowii]
MLEILCGRPAVDRQIEEEQRSLVLWAQQGIKEKKLDQLIDPRLRDQISPHCLKVFTEVANNCLDSHPKGRPTMADVVVRLECALASEKQRMVPSTEEEEDDDFSVGGDVDDKSDEDAKMDESLARGDASSSYTSALYSDKSQSQHRSKGMVSRVFQRGIRFLAKGAAIKGRKRKVDDSHGEQSLSANSSSHLRLQWENVTLNFLSSAASGGNEAYLKGQIFPTPNLRIFSFSELKCATKNFRMDRVVGEGGFGRVYKGWLEEKNGSRLAIAVKKLNRKSMQGFDEWQSELNFLRRLNFLGRFSHPNIVKLLGYRWGKNGKNDLLLRPKKKNDLLLVYEFMPKGSLDNHLFGRGSAVQSLPWDIRLNILTGAARGLAFLHTLGKQVIYRDFKTSNILLDESYNAKLSVFGLAKTGPLAGESHVSTRVMGTYGYAAPEYIASGHLYVKSDVYGFGVVLVEMLTGSRAVDRTRPSGKQELVNWVKPYLSQRRKLTNIMDSRLEGNYPAKSAFRIAQVALKCLEPDPKARPSMKEVVGTLELLDQQ